MTTLGEDFDDVVYIDSYKATKLSINNENCLEGYLYTKDKKRVPFTVLCRNAAYTAMHNTDCSESILHITGKLAKDGDIIEHITILYCSGEGIDGYKVDDFISCKL